MNYAGSGKVADRGFMAILSAPPVIFSLLFILGYFDLMYYFTIDIRKLFFYIYLATFLSPARHVSMRHIAPEKSNICSIVKKGDNFCLIGRIISLGYNDRGQFYKGLG